WQSSSRLGMLILLALVGCGKSPPPITEVEGVLLLNKQPLPNAQIEFVPELKDFGAEMNSMAVTDEKGFFRLTCNQNQQPGAAVGTHRVVVTEPATPKELRGQDEKTQKEYRQYLAGLKNRPIPDVYATVGKTPLRIEVKS